MAWGKINKNNLLGVREFLTGELAHGAVGIIHDYMDMFGLNTPSQIVYALELMGMKKG